MSFIVWKRCSLSLISEGLWGKKREERGESQAAERGAGSRESTEFNKTGIGFQQRKTLAGKDAHGHRNPP